ncbi:MAG TPA: hypothetical protein VKR54_04210 [Candidatus Babeliales bacterium]|jgi:type II secretory pathway component PulJ|nr:hypothetical protein [Candidatus Babeliales bacterium]
MCHKKGFSLLSFLLYLVLFTMITFFSCHIIVSLIIPSLASMRTCQSIISLHIASDLFVRDMHAMRELPFYWKLITPQELVWHVDDHDIGWCFSHHRLERKEGIYNKEWKSKTTSVIVSGIEQATFTVEKAGNEIVGIEMRLTPTVAIKKPIICYVTVKSEEKV